MVFPVLLSLLAADESLRVPVTEQFWYGMQQQERLLQGPSKGTPILLGLSVFLLTGKELRQVHLTRKFVFGMRGQGNFL
jgi:hypothetical protein